MRITEINKVIYAFYIGYLSSYDTVLHIMRVQLTFSYLNFRDTNFLPTETLYQCPISCLSMYLSVCRNTKLEEICCKQKFYIES